MDIETGISIIMNSWMRLRRDEVLHFITDETHLREAEAMKRWAAEYDVVLKLTLLSSDDVQAGDVIERIAYQLSYEDAIIGATDFSFITTSAVKNAARKGARFLSLPLSCTDGRSLLEQDFIAMDTRWTEKAAHFLTGILNKNDTVHITTKRGTDLTFSKKGRRAGYFNGVTAKKGAIGSSSFDSNEPSSIFRKGQCGIEAVMAESRPSRDRSLMDTVGHSTGSEGGVCCCAQPSPFTLVHVRKSIGQYRLDQQFV